MTGYEFRVHTLFNFTSFEKDTTVLHLQVDKTNKILRTLKITEIF